MGGNKQIMQFMQKFPKKIGKKPSAIFKQEYIILIS